MLKTVLAAFCILAAVAISACADPGDPLNGYVESSAKLEVTGAGLEGRLSYDGTVVPIRALVYGLDSWEDVESAVLGIHTTERFRFELGEAGMLFSGLDAQARTLLLLRARGFALSPGQFSLSFPGELESGGSLVLKFHVQPAAPNSADGTVSVVGSGLEVP